ncbi:MAG TPA: ABC transporter permease [Cyclobacteriaceae bacterium]|nr:ABC transporter permease [Cyclobacteriaceae bacterium]
MFINYLVIAFRNLAKYKIFSIINITGMAVSLASCLLISIFVVDELSYDRHHPDGDRTYRVYNIVDNQGSVSTLPILPYPFAPYLKRDFPEIESAVRFLDTYEEQLFEYEGKKVKEGKGIISESPIFDMLSLKIINGDKVDAVTRPLTAALSESLARKYFGDSDPIGKSIKIDNIDREVTAVFADAPEQFHLRINYVTSLSTTTWEKRNANNFRQSQLFTYIKLVPGADAAALEAKLPAFNEKYTVPAVKQFGMSYETHLQNIRDIHLHSSNFEWEIAVRGDAQSVYILLATAIMILSIACLNFINLSTARATKRMKEVGIRKTTGAQRSQLVVQFLSESILFTFIGLLLAIMLAELALPSMNMIVEKNLTIPYNFSVLAAGFGLCIVLGTLAGGYPAIYLSGFRPAIVLSRKTDKVGGSGVFRQSLVVVQFMLSFFLIAASMIVLSQNDLISSKDLGFNKEHVVVIPLRSPQLADQEATKLRYKDHPNVLNVTLGFGLPGDIVAGDGVIDPETGKDWNSGMFLIDFDYIETMGMQIVAGRPFTRDLASDSSGFVVNETFVSTFGLGSPGKAIGKKLEWNRWDKNGVRKKGEIIGVVKDFHYKSLREKLSPAVLQIFPGASWKLAARIKGENIPETLAHLKRTYESLDPEWTFEYNFMDDKLDAMYKSEQRLGKLFMVFTYLAIAVACLGLFGLVEYSVNQRTKEISIRKIFGASVSSLLVLLTQRYFVLLTISCLLIVPIVWYSAQQWLSRFAYKIDLEPGLFIKAGLMIVVITAVTVSFQSIRAALSNPVKNLRND